MHGMENVKYFSMSNIIHIVHRHGFDRYCQYHYDWNVEVLKKCGNVSGVIVLPPDGK